MLLGLTAVASACRDTRFRVLQPVFPERLAVFGDARLAQTQIVTLPVPLCRRIEIAGIDADPRTLIRHFTFLVKRVAGLRGLLRRPVVDHLLLIFDSLRAIGFECPGHCYGAFSL